ncbi:hypothetical protein NE237_013102 [Protea cynaroides]|uniref:Jacalin-type lectin domain-containing protein n=1 Tax=Protea cynaroides TaxID=273540 RepID=A0A9Q0H373_9MAGN|nr:hypothetical protein NE237_013102 [Protea cynaroides]
MELQISIRLTLLLLSSSKNQDCRVRLGVSARAVRYCCEEMYRKVGPEGNHYGYSWDDGTQGKVKQIFVSYSDDGFNSIQTVLEFPRGSVLMKRHGGEGSNFTMINLEEDESIILVSGFYHLTPSSYPLRSKSSLKSLSIRTTLREYGPYTCKVVCDPNDIRHFKFEVEAGKFAGFHGLSEADCLNAIGIHVHTEAMITLEEILRQGATIDMMVNPKAPRLTLSES